MQTTLTLQELLASEITRAALRADGLDLREFKATLTAAAQRVRAQGLGAHQREPGLRRAPASRPGALGACAALPCFGA